MWSVPSGRRGQAQEETVCQGYPSGGVTGAWGEGWAWHGVRGAEVSDLGVIFTVTGG